MSVDEMRVRLRAYYQNSQAWAARLARMNDIQIYAIYMRIFARN